MACCQLQSIIHIVVEPKAELYLVNETIEDPKEQFWNYIKEIDEIKFHEIQNEYRMRKLLEEKLNKNLQFIIPTQKDQLKSHISYGIEFKIAYVGYGSLTLGIGVTEGIGLLASTFGYNQDFFKSYLKQTLDTLFNSNWFDYDILIPEDINNMFINNSNNNPLANARETDSKKNVDRAQKLRNIINYSFFLPVLLSIIVLFFLGIYFLEDRRTYAEHIDNINKTQEQLLQHYEQRLKENEALYNKILHVRLVEKEESK